MTYFLGHVPMCVNGTICKNCGNDNGMPFLLLKNTLLEHIQKICYRRGGENHLAIEAKNPLSNEFKVAAEILGCLERGEKVWLGKLQERLSGEISKNTISAALDTLFDWGIIKAEYGETEKGRAGRLLLISNESKPLIKELYEKYWKDRKK